MTVKSFGAPWRIVFCLVIAFGGGVAMDLAGEKNRHDNARQDDHMGIEQRSEPALKIGRARQCEGH